MKPRWTRKPPAAVGHYWVAIRDNSQEPYRRRIVEVFGPALPEGLHVSGLFSCALPLTHYRGSDLWWWPMPIEAPPAPGPRGSVP